MKKVLLLFLLLFEKMHCNNEKILLIDEFKKLQAIKVSTGLGQFASYIEKIAGLKKPLSYYIPSIQGVVEIIIEQLCQSNECKETTASTNEQVVLHPRCNHMRLSFAAAFFGGLDADTSETYKYCLEMVSNILKMHQVCMEAELVPEWNDEIVELELNRYHLIDYFIAHKEAYDVLIETFKVRPPLLKKSLKFLNILKEKCGFAYSLSSEPYTPLQKTILGTGAALIASVAIVEYNPHLKEVRGVKRVVKLVETHPEKFKVLAGIILAAAMTVAMH